MEKIKRPNILMIITDQQCIDTISAYAEHFKDLANGCHHLKTPNIDRMVRGGYSFLLSYSANPVSCPARASIFTGRYSINHGVTYNNIGIDRQVPNLAQWLTTHSNYQCYYAGKWHAGGQWNYPEISGNRKVPGFETIPIGEYPLGEHTDYSVSTAVKGFLAGYNREEPFFIVAGLMNPHDICFWTRNMWGDLIVPKEDQLKLKENRPPLAPNRHFTFQEPARFQKSQQQTDDFWRNYTYDYYRMVEKADADIGRILDAVETRKDDTIVIFTSDHGEGLGRHSKVSKWLPYDFIVRVPLVFYAPGRFTQQIDNQNLASGIDIFPTICEIAGVTPPEETNGKSLLKLLEGDTPNLERSYVISEFMITGRLVSDGRYKYVKVYEFSGKQDQPFVRKDTGEKTVFHPGCGEEYRVDPVQMLFDTKTDPWELNNLINRSDLNPVLTRLQEELRRWEANVKPGVHFDRN